MSKRKGVAATLSDAAESVKDAASNVGSTIASTAEGAVATVKQTATKARKAAVEDAVQKARTLSEAAGVTLGRVLEISDQSFASPPVPFAEKAFARAADAVPIAAGEPPP